MTGSEHVPFVDLGRVHGPLAEELRRKFAERLERGDFILGDDVGAFEHEFAGYLDTGDCIGVNSGTAALAIALEAAGIGRGDEVIVPAHTFIASALAVEHAGARAVFCDVDEETGLIDLEAAHAAVTPRTAAVMVVHLYGQACDMDAAGDFADRHKLALIEDAAQAHGARWDGRRVGGFGTAAAFSFYPSKNLGALGDGGAIASRDRALAARCRRLRNLGMEAKGQHVERGANERLDTMQASFLRLKLPHLDEWNKSRRDAADLYHAALPVGVTPLPIRVRAENVHHLFAVRVSDRDGVAEALARSGVGTGVHYTPAVHQQPPFAGTRGEFPVAERWAAEELSLPMFPGLRADEVERVCAALADAVGEGAPVAHGTVPGR